MNAAKGFVTAFFTLSAFIATSADYLYAAEPHAHGQDAVGLAALKLDNSKKWATDAPLRRGMAEIRSAVAQTPAAVHAGTAKPEAYAALGQKVDQEVARIVAECKLAPAADAQLHLVIAEIMAGSDLMKEPQAGQSPREGVLRIAAALNAYGRHFDHPGWKPLAD